MTGSRRRCTRTEWTEDRTVYVKIRKRSVGTIESADDPFALLGACHERIRAFSATSLRMLRAKGAPPEDVADAAGRVHLYFTVGLPLHAEDEDVELTDVISSVLPPDPVFRALEQMEAEHCEIVEAVAALAPTWAGLATGTVGVAEARGAALGPTEHLVDLFDRHLALEEKVIFAFGRQALGPEALATLTQGIRARRHSSRP